jgi:hypothetical protein
MEALYRSLGPSLSHGQTGIYMLYDYWALWLGGANLFLLRLPSLISGGLLLVAAVTILRLKGFSTWWQAVLLLAFGAQSVLMYNAGNARPYMMLAATAVCMIAYYLYPIEERRAWLPRMLAVFGLLVGAVAHPYFIVFFALAVGFGVWDNWFTSGTRPSWRYLIRFVNPRFVVPAAILYVIVGSLTWLRGTPDFQMDPWELLGIDGAARLFVRAQLGMLLPSPDYPPRILIALVVIVIGFAVAVAFRCRDRKLAAPAVLFGLAVLTSVLFSTISVLNSYWVIERQWIAGLAVGTVAVVWFLAQAAASLRLRRATFWRWAVFAVSAYAAVTGAREVIVSLPSLPAWRSSWDVTRAEVPSDAATRTPSSLTNDEWVQLGNWNVALGGPVWPSVGSYYQQYVDDPVVEE